MTENPVLGQMRQLVALQKIDAQIYQYQKELQEKPALLEKLRQDFDAKKTGLKGLENKHKSILLRRKEQELELQSREDAIAKSNIQLSQIKTNKEYTAKISEIESIKADKSIIEEKILASYDEGDRMKAAMDKEKDDLAAEEKKYNVLKKEIDEEVRRLEEQVRLLQEERKQISPGIEKVTLERYEKILVNKEGLAIVPVQGGVCGGCYMNVPAQVINEIKMHENMIYCEMCARILYLEEDLESRP